MVSPLRLLVPLCALASCAHSPAPSTNAPVALDLRAVAAEIDPGPIDPVWPKLPESMRVPIATRWSTLTDPRARLAEARARLDLGQAMIEHDATRLAEGLYLIEP